MVKVTKSQLKELIRQAIVEDIMDKEIKNAKTGNMIKVRTALQLPDEHPANKKAKDMVAKSGISKDSGEKQEPEKETKPSAKIKSDPFDDKEKSSDEPKERPKSMRDLDWDSELEPYEIEGWVQDNKSSIPNRVQFSLNKLIDNHADAYAEAEATGDYDKPNEIQKQIDQLLTKAMTRTGKSVNESKKRRYTVKEVRMWMKKLEENRYKKVYNSDARRVAWMVNNEGRTLDEMPMSMKKKWSKAQYGRE